MSRKPTFRRLVLLSEDAYKSALQCMSKEALGKATDHTVWFDKNNVNGQVEKIQATAAMRTESVADNLATTTTNTTVEEASATETLPVSVPASTSQTTTDVVDTVADNTTAPTDSIKALTSNRKNIPLSYRVKYDALLKKLVLTNRFHTDSNGRLVLNGDTVVQNSNFHKLFNTLFANTSTDLSDVPNGFVDFVSALRKEGIKPTEVTSKVGKLALANQLGTGFRKRTLALSSPPGKRPRILRVY